MRGKYEKIERSWLKRGQKTKQKKNEKEKSSMT
jgi:hypothetical protein